MHALTQLAERLAAREDLESGLDGALDILSSVLPADFLVVTRITPRSGDTVFYSSLGNAAGISGKTELCACLRRYLESRFPARQATDYDTRLEMAPPCLRTDKGTLSGNTGHAALVIAPCGNEYFDLLLLGFEGPVELEAEAKDFFSAVLRMVRSTYDQHAYKAKESRSYDRVLRAKQEWQISVDALPQLICLVNADGRVLRVNRSLETLGLGEVKTITGTVLVELLEKLGIFDQMISVRNAVGSPDASNPSHEANAYPAEKQRFWSVLWASMRQAPVHYGPLFSASGRRFFDLRMQLRERLKIMDSADYDEAICVLVLEDVTEREQARAVLTAYNATLERQVQAKTEDLLHANKTLAREVVAHKKDKRALAVSESKYQTLAENTLVGIYLVEGERFCYCNTRFARMLGFSVNELLGRRMRDFLVLNPVENFAVCSSFLDVNCGGSSGAELQVQRKDGGSVWLQGHQARFSTGSKALIIGNFVDITERKEYELRLLEEQRRTRALSEQLLDAEERERRRVSRELHDGVGQQLGVIRLRLDLLAATYGADWELSHRKTFDEIGNRVKSVLEEVRRVSRALRPSLLDDLGLTATLSWFLREFRSAAPHIEVIDTVEIDESSLSPSLKTQVFRIVQEGFNNVVKHANASLVWISVCQEHDALELKIRDNGIGLKDLEEVEQRGIGLRSMKERAELSGGRLTVGSGDHGGVSIVANWLCVNT